MEKKRNKHKLSPEAREAKREYLRKWRAKNPGYDKRWRKENPEKQPEYDRRKWEKKAANMNKEISRTKEINETITTTNRVECFECGNVFQAQRHTARFCSGLCRKRHGRAKD